MEDKTDAIKPWEKLERLLEENSSEVPGYLHELEGTDASR